MQELLGTFLEMIPNHGFNSLKQFEKTDLLKLIKLFNQVFKTGRYSNIFVFTLLRSKPTGMVLENVIAKSH